MKISVTFIMSFLLLTISEIGASHAKGLTEKQCSDVKYAMRNHIETIYLIEMVTFWSKRDEERPPDITLLQEYEKALAHYDSNASGRGIDVITGLCPMQ